MARGVWAAYYHDIGPNLLSVHDLEIDATHACIEHHGNGVVFLPWGMALADALKAEEERRRNPSKSVDRILWNKRDHDIDEIVIHDCTVHVEQMDDRCWWIGIYKGEGRWAGNFSADSRGRMRFSEQECEIEWDRDESHEARGYGGGGQPTGEEA